MDGLEGLSIGNLAADANFVLHDNNAVLDMARRVVRRRLGVGSDASASAR